MKRIFTPTMSATAIQLDEEKFFNCFNTVSMSFAFVALGVAISLPGPTLPTLAYNLKLNISSMSPIITARAVGYLVGSFCGGFLYERTNKYVMLLVALLLSALGLVVTPFAQTLTLLSVCMAMIGMAMGVFDTAGCVNILEIWQEKSGPYIQNLYFMYAVGATLAPIISTPFIRESEEILNANSRQNSTGLDNSSMEILYNNMTSESFENSPIPFVSWVFFIAASHTLLVSLLFFYLAFKTQTGAVSNKSDTTKEEGISYRLQMLFLLFVFFMIYVGKLISFGVYVYTFATSGEYRFSKQAAAAVNTVFWAFFALGRGLAIVFAIFLSPRSLLLCDLCGASISCVLLVTYPYYMHAAPVLLWVGVAGYGLSIASMFASGISWAEEYITINGRAASALVIGGSVGEMTVPLLVGSLIERNAINLMYAASACVAVELAIYILMQLLANSKGKRRKLKATRLSADAAKDSDEQQSELLD